MTTSGQKLLAAIHEVAAHERGEIQLNTVSVPIKSVTDWRQAAEWAQSRIADLEAEVARLREALRNLLNDTQHAEHPDCEDGPCPVREARAALESKP